MKSWTPHRKSNHQPLEFSVAKIIDSLSHSLPDALEIKMRDWDGPKPGAQLLWQNRVEYYKQLESGHFEIEINPNYSSERKYYKTYVYNGHFFSVRIQPLRFMEKHIKEKEQQQTILAHCMRDFEFFRKQKLMNYNYFNCVVIIIEGEVDVDPTFYEARLAAYKKSLQDFTDPAVRRRLKEPERRRQMDEIIEKDEFFKSMYTVIKKQTNNYVLNFASGDSLAFKTYVYALVPGFALEAQGKQIDLPVLYRGLSKFGLLSSQPVGFTYVDSVKKQQYLQDLELQRSYYKRYWQARALGQQDYKDKRIWNE